MRIFGVIWGFTGISYLLGMAVYRLGGRFLDALSYDWTGAQWAVAIGNTLFMAYSEGYKGFQLRFSPRTAARLKYLYQNPRPAWVLLAPFFIMAFAWAPRRRLIGTYALMVMIIIFILIIQQFNQPWRGVVDLGVVVGLSWGMISFYACCVKAFSRTGLDYPHEVVGE